MTAVAIRGGDPRLFDRIEQPSFLEDAPFLHVAVRRRVLDAAVKMTGMDRDTILSAGRCTDVVRVRWAMMVALREFGLSTVQIASFMGRRDHTTVIHGLRQAATLRQTLPGYDRFCRALIQASHSRGMP